MTIVLNTLEEGAASEQISILIKSDVEVVNTSGMKIAHCMGCTRPLDDKPYLRLEIKR